MQIKISTFKSLLQHSENFGNEIRFFLSEIEARLGTPLIRSELNDYECDLKLIFIETGGSEGLFLENLPQLKEPYYLLTSGGNNSLAASLEIMTYIKKQGLNGEILHGDIDYIVQRIKSLATTSSIIKTLRASTLGVLGKPSNWLIASVPDYALVEKKLGLKLQDISLEVLEEKTKKPHFSNCAFRDSKFSKTELKAASDVYDALSEVVTQFHLKGLTLRCFDLLTSLKMTGCLGLAELNRKGIIGTCEGDIMAMISMYLVQLVTGQSSFQANPSRIDVQKNEIVFAHCTIPFDMVESYRLDTHFESGIGVAIKGELRPEQITIFRLSSNLKHYFVSTGRIIENLDDKTLCRTQIRVSLDTDVKTLLNAPCGNHHIIFYGDHKDEIEELLSVLL